MRSMTGFGAARASIGTRMLAIEIRSVNHRYCDVHLHLPHELAGIESRLEARVRKQIDRGRIDVAVELSDAEGAQAAPIVDLMRARAYRDAYALLAQELGLDPAIPLELIAGAPGVIRMAGGGDRAGELLPEIETTLDSALRDLRAMRADEGRMIAEELRRRLQAIERIEHDLAGRVPLANSDRKLRLEHRLVELLGDRAIEPARVAQEVALMIDRADVTEELARLSSHSVQFKRLLDLGEPVGRKLDFLLQEMHREANTIGSKTASADISHLVVELKSELEKTREQVQNVE